MSLDRLLEAAKYIGWHEDDDKAALTKLLGFDPKTAWCAGFVNAIEKKCGGKGTGKLNARSYLKYGTVVQNPQPGDIVIFKRGLPWQGHVAYYVSEITDSTRVLGGNQDNQVKYKYYPTSSVLGYRRP